MSFCFFCVSFLFFFLPFMDISKALIVNSYSSFRHFLFELECTTFHEAASLSLTPRSFLFIILMATFSPVAMCRPSLTLANPPKTYTKEAHNTDQRGYFKNKAEFKRITNWYDATWADSLINLIILMKLCGSAVLRPFHRHLRAPAARW